MGYLTPESLPPDTICRALFIPNDQRIIANVTGALELLTFPENWDLFGAVIPYDAAAAMLPMFNSFCFNEGACRMIGEIIAFAGDVSPDVRWLACDGVSYLRADYPALFGVIGVFYGATDSIHFNVPDLRSRVPLGFGMGMGLSNYALGDQAGEETHTLITGEQAAHTHVDSGHTHAEVIALPAVGAAIVGVPIPSAIPGVGFTGIGSAIISSSGGDGSHNNVQPILAINFLIVAQQ